MQILGSSSGVQHPNFCFQWFDVHLYINVEFQTPSPELLQLSNDSQAADIAMSAE